MKKVSIIVPIYLSEAFLSKLINSVLHQTYRYLELILVDDGSPDNSGIICDKYAKEDERVIVIHQENKGGCAARNEGLARSSGEYIMFIDGDDWLEPDCVEYLLNLAIENDCQMVTTDRIAHGNSIYCKDEKVRVLSPERAVCEILYAKTPIGVWNKLYSKDVIHHNNISFNVPWFGEGLYFSVMNAQFSNKIAIGHRAVYHYRLDNAQSGTTLRKVEYGKNGLWNIKNIRDRLVIRTPRTLYAVEWHLHRNCFNLLWFILGEGRKSEYNDLYTTTRKELLALTPKVFLHSDVSFVQKVLVLLTGLFPRIAAQMATWRRKMKFKKG